MFFLPSTPVLQQFPVLPKGSGGQLPRSGGGWGGGGGIQFVHGRSRTTVDVRIATKCRDGARGVFTNQADILGAKREAP